MRQSAKYSGMNKARGDSSVGRIPDGHGDNGDGVQGVGSGALGRGEHHVDCLGSVNG